MKILVIEDEKKVASFVKKGLEQEFYTVDTASNGAEGFQMATASGYDLIILDIMLPVMDGLTVTRELRKNKITVPILLLSAKDKIQDKVDGLDAGADDYLTKPFAFEELVARVRALMRRKEAEKSVIIQIRGLALHTQTHKVIIDNQTIDLTPKEYAILEFLMRNKNNIVTRVRLTQHVYEYQFDTDSNIIDVYINKLRGKIETILGEEFIQTVRGAGYIVQDPKG